MSNFKGQVAIVTGAGHGIGREIALSIAKSGADVVVTDVTDAIFEVSRQIEALNSKALPIKCDVSNFDEAKASKSRFWRNLKK